MAIFDEYKQAVQDVLDGNTKEPPRPSAFPDEQDMLAALYAAAAALFLSKEAPGGGSDKFIVTLTPTSPDYSGTMDKTVAEINAAYEAGQEIWFKVLMGGQDEYVLVPLSNADKRQEEYPAFSTYVFDITNDILIVAWTSYTDDGTRQVYATTIYSLTRQAERR